MQFGATYDVMRAGILMQFGDDVVGVVMEGFADGENDSADVWRWSNYRTISARTAAARET
jgi:hypothetical protein